MRFSERERIVKLFEMVEQAAVHGRRCPSNEELAPYYTPACGLPEVARTGRILIEVSGKNFRQCTIKVGPHAGKKTAPPPVGHIVWQRIELGSPKLAYVKDTPETLVEHRPRASVSDLRRSRFYKSEFVPT